MPSSAALMRADSATRSNNSLTVDSNNSRPSTRRRVVVVTEKKSNTEVHAEGALSETNDDLQVVDGKDLSQSIKGESVLERPRVSSQVRITMVTSTTSAPSKKPVPKPEKSRWQTIVSVLTKSAVLLAFVLWLGQTIWRSHQKEISPLAGLNFESQIAELEASFKKTTMMTQAQLEAMDKHVNKFEEKSTTFQSELKMLEGRIDDLGKFLGEFRNDASYLSKQEFEAFLKDLKGSENLEDKGNSLTLDDVRKYAREAIMKEIEKHAADGLGMVDYAVASSGARIVRHSEPYNLGKSGSWFPVSKGRNGVHEYAQKMLEPSFGEPGQCFPLQGNSGFVEIRLRTRIIPNAITLEHVAKSVAFDRSSAPKDCQVSGWFEDPEDGSSGGTGKRFILRKFSYDLEKSNAQTFDIETTEAGIINMVRLDFFSNSGSSSHTCIYRFRVHGHDPNHFPAKAAEG